MIDLDDDEDLEEGPRDDWADQVLLAGSFAHSVSHGHVGYTMLSAGVAVCGACGWGASARLNRIDERTGVFAMLALGRIGHVFAVLLEPARQHVLAAGGDPDAVQYELVDGKVNVSFSIGLPDGFSFHHVVHL